MLSTAAANGGRGGGGGAPAAPQPGLPFIGPSANGNILVAWNPVTQKEAWRGPANSAAGYNQGGTVTTAGNLVFASVTGCLLAFKADTGEQVLGLATGLPASPGPPMTFMLDGKQYIAVAGAIGGGGGGGGGRGGGAAGGSCCGSCWRSPRRCAERLHFLVVQLRRLRAVEAAVAAALRQRDRNHLRPGCLCWYSTVSQLPSKTGEGRGICQCSMFNCHPSGREQKTPSIK